jgi:hypothetical protein
VWLALCESKIAVFLGVGSFLWFVSLDKQRNERCRQTLSSLLASPSSIKDTQLLTVLSGNSIACAISLKFIPWRRISSAEIMRAFRRSVAVGWSTFSSRSVPHACTDRIVGGCSKK